MSRARSRRSPTSSRRPPESGRCRRARHEPGRAASLSCNDRNRHIAEPSHRYARQRGELCRRPRSRARASTGCSKPTAGWRHYISGSSGSITRCSCLISSVRRPGQAPDRPRGRHCASAATQPSSARSAVQSRPDAGELREAERDVAPGHRSGADASTPCCINWRDGGQDDAFDQCHQHDEFE